MATTQARLPTGTLIAVPTNETFRQLQFIDQQQRRIYEAQDPPSSNSFQVVRTLIQGVDFSLQVHVGDFRRILGLPSYSLCPLFRAPVPAIRVAEVDIEDTDHAQDEHEVG